MILQTRRRVLRKYRLMNIVGNNNRFYLLGYMKKRLTGLVNLSIAYHRVLFGLAKYILSSCLPISFFSSPVFS